MNARGKTSLGSLFWIAVLVAIAYSLVMFSGPYVDDFTVKDAMNKAINQANQSDEFLKSFILSQLNNPDVGSHFETDPVTGAAVETPGMGLNNDNIVINRDTVANHITIRVVYDRIVILKPSKSKVTFHFHPQKDGPITR